MPTKPPRPGSLEGIFQWYSRDPKIGEGWRIVIAFGRERKYLSLLATGTLIVRRIEIAAWERDRRTGAARESSDLRPKRLAKRIDKLRRTTWQRAIADQAILRAVIAELRRERAVP
jgi:hypothetical protein